MRRRLPASSIRSMALSGRKRSKCSGWKAGLPPRWRESVDTHAVVDLVLLLQATQNGDDVSLDGGLATTSTVWKRRSSAAASFSMYLRYSLSVVAPMA